MIKYFLKTRLLGAKTEKQKAKFWAPVALKQWERLPEFLLIFMLTLLFSHIAPMMVPIGFAYFTYGYLAYRFTFLYRHEPAYESHGELWEYLRDRLASCLYLYQIITVILLSIKQGPVQAALVFLVFLASKVYFDILRTHYPCIASGCLPQSALEPEECNNTSGDAPADVNIEMDLADAKEKGALSVTDYDRTAYMPAALAAPLAVDKGIAAAIAEDPEVASKTPQAEYRNEAFEVIL